jgi:hypothetical protein
VLFEKAGGRMTNLVFRKGIGFANIMLGLLCLLCWWLNTMGWIRVGDPTAQLIIAPVCLALGVVFTKETSRSHDISSKRT